MLTSDAAEKSTTARDATFSCNILRQGTPFENRGETFRATLLALFTVLTKYRNNC